MHVCMIYAYYVILLQKFRLIHFYALAPKISKSELF